MRRAGGPETGGSNPLSPTNTKGPSSDGPFVLSYGKGFEREFFRGGR
jgi:hypothetical protein